MIIILSIAVLRTLELYGDGWELREIMVLWNRLLIFDGITREEFYEKNYLQKNK